MTVGFSLIAQIGEQVDFLRFLPRAPASERVAWWIALLPRPRLDRARRAEDAGGSFLAYLAMRHGCRGARRRADPDVSGGVRTCLSPRLALALAGTFVIMSQIKINVTNAYAGLDRLVELLLAPHAQPPRPRGLAGVQH